MISRPYTAVPLMYPVDRSTPVTMTIMRGLPGSGKTTWVQEQIRGHETTRARVSRDYLRLGLHGTGLYTPRLEEQVTMVELAIVQVLLLGGVDVYVDDTNLHPESGQRWFDMAKRLRVAVQTQDFRDVPLGVCIERDRARSGTAGCVGEGVIRDMYDRYLTGDTSTTSGGGGE